MNVGKKIKELRAQKGFSQEQLAENSGVSIRTVQRVETGETVPNGDTLIKLSHALNVSLDDILEFAPHEDVGYLALLNLSALTFIFHPMLGIVCPLIMWILKRDRIKFVDHAGKQLMLFQTGWTLLLYVSIFIMSGGQYILFDVKFLDHALFGMLTNPGFTSAFIFGLFLLNFIFIAFNTVRIYKGKKVKYLIKTA